MHSNEEPNSFFGGMAVPQWESDSIFGIDPAHEHSWLFKMDID